MTMDANTTQVISQLISTVFTLGVVWLVMKYS